jgi:DNA polymerase I-like protein with 3'-5' exonuclease and polymerase domains
VEIIWRDDLKRAFDLAQRGDPFPIWEEEKLVYPIESEDDAVTILENLIARDEIFFDIEATGLKPYNRSTHRIVSWAFASGGEAWAFLHPQGERSLRALRRLLQSERVGKGAHNMKFEHTWVREILGYEVRGWAWDSMQAAHIIDNRSGITSLEFQSYVHFGKAEWDTDTTPFLKSDDGESANASNRILELIRTTEGRDRLLLYNGIDALLTERLSIAQRKNPVCTQTAYKLFHEGVLALADAEAAGIRVDSEEGLRQKTILDRKIERLERKTHESPLGQTMKRKFGEAMNLDSGKQLADVLYGDMQIKPTRIGEKSQRGSVDAEALASLNVPGLEPLLQSRKLKKVRDTYLDGFLREAHDGWLHPSFSLHLARSYRSSSSSPNFQNVPVRSEEAMRACRGVLFPRGGRQLIELDCTGIEVRIAACITKDPSLLSYVRDPTSDMHADMARQLFKLDQMDHRTHAGYKRLRYSAKNGFVFPQFYGDYYGNCADYLARNSGLPRKGGDPWQDGQGIELPSGRLSNHLIGAGLKTYEDFEQHVRRVERDFWERRFRAYTEWKNRTWREYQRRGYAEFPTGFRCSDVMTRNECLNRTIQGSAFHCFLWIFTRLNDERRRRRWSSRLIGQIHDSVVIDAESKEIDEILEVTSILLRRLREEWEWIIVPLEIEAELCGVDQPWSEKQPHKIVKEAV